MKKLTIILVLLLGAIGKLYSQDDPKPTAYKLNSSRDKLVKVYQEKDAAPDLSVFKYWNAAYYFKVEDDSVVANNIRYVRIYIPSGNSALEQNKALTAPRTRISNADFNTFCYITYADFTEFKKDVFPKFTGNFILTALTVPLKIRGAVGNHTSSLYNSNFNVGTFIGWRTSHGTSGGVTLGGMLGFSSQDQNSSTNDGITDESNESMSAVNYGLGLIVDVAKKFQIGGVVGWDHGYGNLSKTYIYQHKPWFAISLNFNFLDLGGKGKTPSQD